MKLPLINLPKIALLSVLLYVFLLLVLTGAAWLGAHVYLLNTRNTVPAPISHAQIFMQAASGPLACDEPQLLPEGHHYGTRY